MLKGKKSLVTLPNPTLVSNALNVKVLVMSLLNAHGNLPEDATDVPRLIVVRCALTLPKESKDWCRRNIFHTYVKCGGSTNCKVIIDSGSYINAVSSSLVTRL